MHEQFMCLINHMHLIGIKKTDDINNATKYVENQTQLTLVGEHTSRICNV